MLQFALDDTSVELILTLTEKVTLSTPYYLFVFTHVTTKDVVTMIKSVADDESGYTSRYNQFTIDPSVVFSGKQPGEWHYKVYEQQSVTNVDPAQAGNLLEVGKVMIGRATEFSYNKYDGSTTYKAYNG
jgi:hypothetical protein